MTSTPDSMIERVARAIASASVGYSIKMIRFVDGEYTYAAIIEANPDVRREFPSHADASDWVDSFVREAKARAAIAAMREPTDYMLRSMYAAKAVCQIGDNPTEVARYAYGNKYTAAIDAALEGK